MPCVAMMKVIQRYGWILLWGWLLPAYEMALGLSVVPSVALVVYGLSLLVDARIAFPGWVMVPPPAKQLTL